LQTNYRDVKREPKEVSLGKRTGKGVSGVEKKVYNSTNLFHFYQGRITVVETDTGHFAIGCILFQYKGRWLHWVAFHSQKLNSGERNYEIHDTELLAIMEALRKWRR